MPDVHRSIVVDVEVEVVEVEVVEVEVEVVEVEVVEVEVEVVEVVVDVEVEVCSGAVVNLIAIPFEAIPSEEAVTTTFVAMPLLI